MIFPLKNHSIFAYLSNRFLKFISNAISKRQAKFFETGKSSSYRFFCTNYIYLALWWKKSSSRQIYLMQEEKIWCWTTHFYGNQNLCKHFADWCESKARFCTIILSSVTLSRKLKLFDLTGALELNCLKTLGKSWGKPC